MLHCIHLKSPLTVNSKIIVHVHPCLSFYFFFWLTFNNMLNKAYRFKKKLSYFVVVNKNFYSVLIEDVCLRLANSVCNFCLQMYTLSLFLFLYTIFVCHSSKTGSIFNHLTRSAVSFISLLCFNKGLCKAPKALSIAWKHFLLL